MGIIKNYTTRPSKEVKKKKRLIRIIVIFSTLIVLGILYYLLMGSSFFDNLIKGNSNNSLNVSITYASYSPKSPILGDNVTFKHTIRNANGKYYKWFVYENSNLKSKASKCQKIKTNYFTENDSFSSPKNTSIKKYMNVTVYSDSNCSKKIVSVNSSKLQWRTSTKPIISFSNYNTTKPTLGNKVTFKHTIKYANGKYYKWFVYENSKLITKSNTCNKLTSNSYTESDSLTSPKNSSLKKYLRVTVYSDSNCKNVVTTSDSTKLTWSNVSTDKKLTKIVKDIIRNQGGRWYNSKTSCSDAGINENDTSSRAKLACLAFSQVGRENTDCCKFVKEMQKWAGLTQSCFVSSGFSSSGSIGKIAQWGQSGCHVAIYINDQHVINAN